MRSLLESATVVLQSMPHAVCASSLPVYRSLIILPFEFTVASLNRLKFDVCCLTLTGCSIRSNFQNGIGIILSLFLLCKEPFTLLPIFVYYHLQFIHLHFGMAKRLCDTVT